LNSLVTCQALDLTVPFYLYRSLEGQKLLILQFESTKWTEELGVIL